MHSKEIFATIHLAHYFGSAFTPDQAYRYLRVKMARDQFDNVLAELIEKKIVFKKNDALFIKNLEEIYQQKKVWSRTLFQRHKRYVKMIAKAPWIEYAALTGANAFESCKDKDDIDLFIITQKNRLWLCYTLLVIFSKLSRKREILCINYLVDEENLSVHQQNYYTAVQIMQMVPILDNAFSQRLIEQNPWIFDFLPNAAPQLPKDCFYVIKNGTHQQTSDARRHSNWVTALNRLIFQKYSQRLIDKYPDKIGQGIVLKEGIAKLNRVDHQDIYEEIYAEIFREIEVALPA